MKIDGMLKTIGAAAILLGLAPSADAKPVVDGKARFEVVTPSLIRLEYAADGTLENRRTQTTDGRLRSAPRFRTRVAHGLRVIDTGRVVLRWRRGSGTFGAKNLSVRIGKR